MGWICRQRTARLTTVVLSLGLIAAASSGSAPESTSPAASTDWQDVPCQQDHSAAPLDGSPELWKFRRLTQR